MSDFLKKGDYFADFDFAPSRRDDFPRVAVSVVIDPVLTNFTSRVLGRPCFAFGRSDKVRPMKSTTARTIRPERVSPILAACWSIASSTRSGTVMLSRLAF